MSYERCFSEVRSLLQGKATRETFLSICAQVEQAATLDKDACVSELIPYASEALKKWPSAIKMAPMLWINKLTLEALPLEVLHLCSSLSFLAAQTEDYYRSEHAHRLFAWLEALPEDAPALEGLSFGRGDVMCQALVRAVEQEPDARFHPKGPPQSNGTLKHLSVIGLMICDMESEQIELLLGSPLCRQLRVLDASWDAVHKFVNDQDLLNGRGLTLDGVAWMTSSDRLEVLDLHGQLTTHTAVASKESMSPEELSCLKRLKALNLGGGYHIGDASLRELARVCPDLEWLNVSPGTLTSFLFDDDLDWEGWAGDEAYRLGIYQDQLQSMTRTSSGLKSIKELKHLKYVHFLRSENVKMKRGVKVTTNYSSYAGELWTRYFEL